MVDRLLVHGGALDFRTLCQRAVPRETRYLILDLDRTVHLERNMGELLGWELCALHGYGADRLLELEPRRTPTSVFLDWSRPAAVLRYLAVTTRIFAWPGLFYVFCGKLPARNERLRRLSFRAFGPDPIAAVQRVPQIALLHHMACVPMSTLRSLAERVWERYRGDQTIEPDDLAWLRERCPGIRIVMSSASPRPVLEVAAAALGVDDVLCTEIEEQGGYSSSPFEVSRLLLAGRPRRMAGPRQVRINSGRSKIEALLARYPDLADRGVVSVGVTDTGYGEDACWAEHFTHVVDVNSSTPFSPLVGAASPLREIHSAAVLTRSERARRAGGSEPCYLDPRRRAAPPPRDLVLTAADLLQRLGDVPARFERLARLAEEHVVRLAPARGLILGGLAASERSLEEAVAAFNEAPESGRPRLMARLRRELRTWRRLRRQRTLVERPLSDVAFSTAGLCATAREKVAGGRL